MNLEKFPALVLNADYRPLSLYPLELKPAYESIRNVYEETVTVVAEYDEIVRSPTITMRIPSVVALKAVRREIHSGAIHAPERLPA